MTSGGEGICLRPASVTAITVDVTSRSFRQAVLAIKKVLRAAFVPVFAFGAADARTAASMEALLRFASSMSRKVARETTPAS